MSPGDVAAIVRRAAASRPPEGMTTRIVAIDGPGGAGKSTLAQRVSAALGDAPIVHTDDFASWDTPLEWWPRLLEQVLLPLSSSRPGTYQRYDWDERRLAEWHAVAPSEYLVLEGVSASRKAFRPYLTLAVWVQTDRDERLRRGLDRDGEAARGQWLEWMAREDEYIERERPHTTADLVVSGDGRRRRAETDASG